MVPEVRIMLEAELFAFLEGASDGVFAVRETGEICFWNRAAEELFSYSAEQVLGRTCSELLHGVGALGTQVCHERCVELQCTLTPKAMPNFDLNVATGSGERKWVNISTVPYLNRRTQKTMLVHLARDISSQKRREDVFRKMIAISREVAGLDTTMNGAAPVTPLSSQELEILRMFAAGNDASRISKALGISPQTLRNHLHHINKKLRTHNRLEAVTHALQRRLI
jgi:PAS domain S-box-containing protein